MKPARRPSTNGTSRPSIHATGSSPPGWTWPCQLQPGVRMRSPGSIGTRSPSMIMRAALPAGRVGRELAGPGELGVDVLPVPDVPALGPGGLGELLTLPERQRGQL